MKGLKELIFEEGYDINAKDQDGNTLLHLVALEREKNRKMYGSAHSSISNVIYSHMNTLAEWGANPCIKNNKNETPIDTLINDTPESSYDYFSIHEDAVAYFFLLEKNYPNTATIASFFKYFEKNEKGLKCFAEECQKINPDRLPHDCLEIIFKWMNNKQWEVFIKNYNDPRKKELIDNVNDFKKKLADKINYLKYYPYLDDAILKLINAESYIKSTLFRVMLTGDIDYPLPALINRLLEESDDENSPLKIDQNIMLSLQSFAKEYEDLRCKLEFVGANLSPLGEKEIKLHRDIYENLNTALNGNLFNETSKAFEVKSGAASSERKFLLNRYTQFKDKDMEKRKRVFDEINQYNNQIQNLFLFKETSNNHKKRKLSNQNEKINYQKTP